MSLLFADSSNAWVAAAGLVLLLCFTGAMFYGGAMKRQAQAEGDTSSAGYYLKVTLFLLVALALLFGGMVLMTSYRDSVLR